MQKEIVDIEKAAWLQKVSESKGGEEPRKSHAKSLINENLEERNQATTEEIRGWHEMLYTKLSFWNIFFLMLFLQKAKSMWLSYSTLQLSEKYAKKQ